MKSILVMMATASTEAKLVKELEEAISEWKVYQDDERMKAIIFYSQLIMLRHVTQGDVKKAMQVVQDMENVDSVVDNLFNNKN
jgi:hypothetical protein